MTPADKRVFLLSLSAMVEAAKLVEQYWPEELNGYDVSYPFQLSFDEMVADMRKWEIKVINALGGN